MTWGGIVGERVSVLDIREVVRAIDWSKWRPDFIVLHNTAAPSLDDRPTGFTRQHMLNLEKYYRDDKGWPSGPHFFVDDFGIWLFSPMNKPGTHSPSWNSRSIGIEMLGDYNRESFTYGRGNVVATNTAYLIAALSGHLGFSPNAWKFHMEDPRTTHDCPGKNARNARGTLTATIGNLMAGKRADAGVVKTVHSIDAIKYPDTHLPPWGEWNKKD